MSRKERSLTPAEVLRKEKFEALCRKMEAEGYERHDLTVGIVFANAVSIFLMLPFVVLLYYGYFLVNGYERRPVSVGGALLFIALLLLLTALHEGIHAITWAAFAKGHFLSISFGIIWSTLSPYCTCAETMKRRQYVLGAAMPTLVLGFGLGAASVAFGSWFLTHLAALMLISGGGDFLIILKVLSHPSGGKQAVYCDHPYECGAEVFEKRP